MFKPKTLADWCEWIGTITGILGAALISSNIGYIGWAYVVFCFSSFSFMYFSYKLERWPFFIMNVIFLVINIWGIWRWLIGPMVL